MFDPKKCAFCQKDIQPIIMENGMFWAKFTPAPVTKGHSLIVLNEHKETLFDLDKEEIEKCFELLFRMKKKIDDEFHPDGYNVGANIQEAAGQSVNHFHLHLIPRYKGDVEDPRGGVRNILGKNVPPPPRPEDFIKRKQ